MQEKKDFPPAEVSLKYMACNVKEISENLKQLVLLFKSYSEELSALNSHKNAQRPHKIQDSPF
jgi:hypothetical protein